MVTKSELKTMPDFCGQAFVIEKNLNTMDSFSEQLIGRWRTYKIFNPCGTVALCNSVRFYEVAFESDGTLKKLRREGNVVDNIVPTYNWRIQISNQRCF